MVIELILIAGAAVLARRASAPADTVPADGAPRQAVRAALVAPASSTWAALAAQLRDLQRFYNGVVGKPLRVTRQIAARVAHAGPLAVADELIAGLVPPRPPWSLEIERSRAAVVVTPPRHPCARECQSPMDCNSSTCGVDVATTVRYRCDKCGQLLSNGAWRCSCVPPPTHCALGHLLSSGTWCRTCDRGVSGCDRSCYTGFGGIVHSATCQRPK